MSSSLCRLSASQPHMGLCFLTDSLYESCLSSTLVPTGRWGHPNPLNLTFFLIKYQPSSSSPVTFFARRDLILGRNTRQNLCIFPHKHQVIKLPACICTYSTMFAWCSLHVAFIHPSSFPNILNDKLYLNVVNFHSQCIHAALNNDMILKWLYSKSSEIRNNHRHGSKEG